jgi:alpha-galactosidase
MLRQPIRAGLAFFLLAVLSWHASALTNNLALTPPMGWNDWNAYGCGISESIVTNNAGVIAANGMKAAGYQYVNIDDCWMTSRGANGVIVANAANFPDGIAWLANYVHSTGLKFGIYSDHGTNTCQSKPASYGYEYVDANTYAQWGADYLKYDNCQTPQVSSGSVDYGRMSAALMASGRPIAFCICGAENENTKGFESWSPVDGNQWRSTGDISDTYSTMISHLDPNSTTAYVAGPGRWNDPDMLEVGRGGLTTNQDQVHFTMWCMMAAPLIMGNNLTQLTSQALATLTNPEAIAVDQDPAGEQGIKVINNTSGVGTNEVWSKTLGYDFSTKAVALLNRWGPPTNITVYWTNLGLQAGNATVRDLLAHSDLGTFANSFTAMVPTNSVMMLKVVGTPPALPVLGTNYLNNLQSVYAYTGSGTIVKNKSIGGNSITLGGMVYTNGIGVNSYSGIDYDLGGICSQFQATIGVDGEVGASGSVDFQVYADGALIYDSGVMTGSSTPQVVNLNVTGVSRLILGVGDADDSTSNDHADWANALVVVTNTTPQPPAAPTGLAAMPGIPISLTWNATVSATNYNIMRSSSISGPFNPIGTSRIATYSDSNVTAGLTYYYEVSATSSIGTGGISAEAGATACSLPTAPTNLTTSVTMTNAKVTWNAVAGATGYTIERSLSNTPYTAIASNVVATNYSDTNVTPGTVYYYAVIATNACNTGPRSVYAPAIIPAAPPTSPPVWNGASLTDSYWTDSANWNGSNLVQGDSVIFDGINRLNNTNNTTVGAVYSNILFDPTAGAFTLNGNAFTLGSTITNSSDLPETITAPIDITNNVTLNGGGNTLVIGGGITNTSASGLSVTLTGTGTLTNLIGGTSGTTLLTMVNSSDDWTLVDNPSSSALTLPWGLWITAGTFNFGTASSAPSLDSTVGNGAPEDFQVGIVSGQTGTFNMVNGSLTTTARLDTGAQISGANGVVNQYGGTLTIGSQIQGANEGGGTSAITISGGTLNVGTAANPTSAIYVASRGTGTFTVSGPAVVNCGTVDVSRSILNGTAGTVNLNGGTLRCTGVNTATANSTSPSSSSTANFNFNGGTLTPMGSSTAFMTDSKLEPVPLTVTVRAGGAIINDAGFSIGILESLQHDSTLGGTPDGGLTKNGSGIVSLTKAVTYTGNTTVNSGTLMLSNTVALTASPVITVAAGATLDATGRTDQTLTLASGQTLTGLGLVNGNAVVGSGATLAPGIGDFTFNNNLTLQPGSTTVITINKSETPSNSMAQVTGNVQYGGTLVITNAGAIPYAANDNFHVFAAGGYGGGFTSIVPVIPAINLAWNTNGLNGGVLGIISSPTPPPGFSSVRATKTNMVFTGTNGLPNWPYVVRASTNIALPLSNWSTLATNQFDASGNFSFTNTVVPGIGGWFYRIQLK